MDRLRVLLEGLQRWKQAAVWSPIAILPLVIWSLSTTRTYLAVTGVLAGIVFNGLARARLALARCRCCVTGWVSPAEGTRRFGPSRGCDWGGRSLFDLRRASGPHD